MALIVFNQLCLAQNNQKPAVAIFGFEIEDDKNDLGTTLGKLLSSELDKSFNVVEREQLYTIIGELEFQQRLRKFFEREDASGVVKTAKLKKAKFSIVGEVRQYKTKDVYFANIINNSTGIRQTVNLTTASDNDDYAAIMEELASKVKKKSNFLTFANSSVVQLKNNTKADIYADGNLIDFKNGEEQTHLPSGEIVQFKISDGDEDDDQIQNIKIDKHQINYISAHRKGEYVRLRKKTHLVSFSADVLSAFDIENIQNSWFGELTYLKSISNGIYVGLNVSAISTTYDSEYTTLPGLPNQSQTSNIQSYFSSATVQYQRYIPYGWNRTVYGEASYGLSIGNEPKGRFQIKAGSFLNQWLSAEIGYHSYNAPIKTVSFNNFGYANIENQPINLGGVFFNLRANFRF